MNSASFNDKQSELLSTHIDASVGQNFIEGVQIINSTDAKSPTISSSFDKPGKFSNETKKESIAETDDSFDIFLPLKVKNYKNGLKKPNTATSANKLKKKKITSSNRICPYFSKRKSPTSSKEDKDLELAIARSLEDVSPSKTTGGVLSDIVNENKPCDTVYEKKAVKQTSNFLKSLTSKTKKPSTNTLLYRRTGEERQEIIIKKIGILLLEKENFHDQSLEKLEINFISSNLEGAWNKNSTLWELSKIEVNDLDEFYVSTLEKFFDRPLVAIEQPVPTMSEHIEENGNAEESSDGMNIKIEEESNQPKDSFETKFNEIKEENNSKCSSIFDFDFNKHNFSVKNKYLTDSLNVLSDDLFSFFNSNELSDFSIILKTGESLPCHQFMLQARCPHLLSNILISEASNSLDFTEYSSEGTRAFFKFLYSGKIDFIYDLSNEDKSDLYVLAKKYKLEFLENFLLKSFSVDSFHVYSQSTCSPPDSPTREAPDSSLGPKENISNKHSKFSSLAHESFEKDKEKFSTSKEQQGKVLSFTNLTETINNFASTSGFNSNQPVTSVVDQSLYDIFKDEIKSPCNSSLLSQSFQSKRKLDYTDVLKETKKVCSENIPIKLEDSPDIVMIDSDSNEGCLSVPTNSSQNTTVSQNNGLEVDNKQSMNEDLFLSPRDSLDFNMSGYFDRSMQEAHVEPKETHPLTMAHYSKMASTPTKSSPHFIKAFPPNKDRSIDKYFEASFPEINDTKVIENFSQQMTLSTPPVNKKALSTPPLNKMALSTPPLNENLSLKKPLTPLQEIIFGEATPKPDYDAMISPELKDELKKYGIKPNLDSIKARPLLRYIYEQIHPIRAELPKYAKEPHASTSKTKSSTRVIAIDDDSSDERKKIENDFAYEEKLFNQSKVSDVLSTKEVDACDSENDLKKTIADFIKSNNELFSNVVLFRPLLFKKFYKTVKEHGIKCSIHELLDVLDDLCVNYHVEKKDNNRQKRKPKKQPVKRKQQKKS
ncbi:unnamed protein product [Nezara viridula]|uniref:BTB domain-containing protein n=1 Tax=Nezara viridula TaxID=85310 RepID=A0A9P0HLW9_NEZVI|nr:unnamed protein product [Nezara viridula]